MGNFFYGISFSECVYLVRGQCQFSEILISRISFVGCVIFYGLFVANFQSSFPASNFKNGIIDKNRIRGMG